VFFIATANLLERVPPPLRDRMEVVRLPGYTPEEKLDITRSYLIPRQTEEAGLPRGRIRWSEPAVRTIITDYTFEAGVRELERKIAAICRKSARRAAEGDSRVVRVEPKTLAKFLGPARHEQTLASSVPEIGAATGLAWTEAGGEVLRIETAITRGRGLVLTGQLGDVMKESAQAALTWVRWRLGDFGIDEDFFSRRELHVHVPAGAIPKDGPSAGVTMATALASLATGIAVKTNVAMTGEVTLRGRVLPVGGVREKALAALRAGIHTMLLPEQNLDDLLEVPKELAKKMKFVGVSHMDEVLEHALERVPGVRKKLRREPMRVATRGHVASVKARGRR
jgi:ATP-dependent Lon protease